MTAKELEPAPVVVVRREVVFDFPRPGEMCERFDCDGYCGRWHVEG